MKSRPLVRARGNCAAIDPRRASIGADIGSTGGDRPTLAIQSDQARRSRVVCVQDACSGPPPRRDRGGGQLGSPCPVDVVHVREIEFDRAAAGQPPLSTCAIARAAARRVEDRTGRPESDGRDRLRGPLGQQRPSSVLQASSEHLSNRRAAQSAFSLITLPERVQGRL